MLIAHGEVRAESSEPSGGRGFLTKTSWTTKHGGRFSSEGRRFCCYCTSERPLAMMDEGVRRTPWNTGMGGVTDLPWNVRAGGTIQHSSSQAVAASVWRVATHKQYGIRAPCWIQGSVACYNGLFVLSTLYFELSLFLQIVGFLDPADSLYTYQRTLNKPFTWSQGSCNNSH